MPVSLGVCCEALPCAQATFYVLDNPGYHVILGLTFLNAVDGIVRCRKRELHFTGPEGNSATVQLVSRQAATKRPIYKAFQDAQGGPAMPDTSPLAMGKVAKATLVTQW